MGSSANEQDIFHATTERSFQFLKWARVLVAFLARGISKEIIGNPLLVGWLHISVHTHGCRSRCGWHSSPNIPSTKAFLVGDAEGNAEL